MTTMARAAFLTGPNTIEVESLPVPAHGDDDAILRIEANGLCGSDLEQFHTGGRMGAVVPGHEPLGIIESIGDGAADRWGVRAGDRVVVEVVLPCHACRQCAAGVHSACENSPGSYGYRPFDAPTRLIGGFAEYMYLHPNTVMHRMDATIPANIAALYNSLAAGIRWGVTLGGVKPGDTVAIFGAGQRGIAAAIAAKAAGASRVIATGLARDAHKLAVARELGVDDTIYADSEDVPARIEEITDGRLADVVVDLTPAAAQPVRDALEAVKIGGTIVLAGLKHGHPIELVTDKLVQKAITMVGARGVEGVSIRAAIDLIESGRYPLEKLNTHVFGLDDIPHALAVLEGKVEGENAIHVAILP